MGKKQTIDGLPAPFNQTVPGILYVTENGKLRPVCEVARSETLRIKGKRETIIVRPPKPPRV